LIMKKGIVWLVLVLLVVPLVSAVTVTNVEFVPPDQCAEENVLMYVTSEVGMLGIHIEDLDLVPDYFDPYAVCHKGDVSNLNKLQDCKKYPESVIAVGLTAPTTVLSSPTSPGSLDNNFCYGAYSGCRSTNQGCDSGEVCIFSLTSVATSFVFECSFLEDDWDVCCKSGCESNSNCPGNTICSEEGFCTSVNMVCTSDSDCEDDQTCSGLSVVSADCVDCVSEGLCKVPSGGDCSLDSDCEDDVDVSLICHSEEKICFPDPATGNFCGDDSDCSIDGVTIEGKSGAFCNEYGVSGFCAEQGAGGSDCLWSTDCQTNACYNFLIPGMGCSCSASVECVGDKVCQNGMCKGEAGEVCSGSDIYCAAGTFCSADDVCVSEGACSNNLDCDPDEVCTLGSCAEYVEPLSCLIDSNCADGKYCKDNFCQSLPACVRSSNCPSGFVCQDRVCVVEAKSGEECDSNSDCGEDLLCSSNGECITEGDPFNSCTDAGGTLCDFDESCLVEDRGVVGWNAEHGFSDGYGDSNCCIVINSPGLNPLCVGNSFDPATGEDLKLVKGECIDPDDDGEGEMEIKVYKKSGVGWVFKEDLVAQSCKVYDDLETDLNFYSYLSLVLTLSIIAGFYVVRRKF
jgi:hypothetical protein